MVLNVEQMEVEVLSQLELRETHVACTFANSQEQIVIAKYL